MFQLDYDELFGEPAVLVDADIGRVLSPSLRRLLSFVYTYTQVRIQYAISIYMHVNLHVGRFKLIELDKFMSFFFQGAIYYFLTILTGVPLGIVYGVLFGLTHYVTMWYVQPLLKLFFVGLRLTAMPLAAIVRAALDPIFHSIGQMFSHVAAQARVRLHGCDVTSEQSKSEASTPRNKRKNRKNRHSLSYSPEWLGFV